MQIKMGKFLPGLAILVVYVVALSVSLPLTVATGAGSKIDNVAVQWNALFSTIICNTPAVIADPNVIFVHLQLAQWHSLIAHKTTGSCTSQEIVIAYASRKVLANYFPFLVEEQIDPLLLHQIRVLRPSEAEQKLGKQLGEAVALDLIRKRTPAREFTLQAVKDALDSEADAPRPGIYRYTNNTPAGRDAAPFIFYDLPVVQPYVVPEAVVFIKKYLSHLKPPKVPSDEWDEEYEKEVNVGRLGWPGRTAEMNSTVALLTCAKVNSLTCLPAATWSTILRNNLPKETSLYDTVTLLAKLSVALHDSFVVMNGLQYGFWFWRPIHAYRAGDARHPPIPDWDSVLPTPDHPEYPSGTVIVNTAAAAVVQNFFGKGVTVPFVFPGTGTFAPQCPVQGPVQERKFGSLQELVRAYQDARMWGGAHFNISVVDGSKVGEAVGEYVDAHWAVQPPSGVLPSPTYLKVHAKLPKKQTGYDPMRLVF